MNVVNEIMQLINDHYFLKFINLLCEGDRLE